VYLKPNADIVVETAESICTVKSGVEADNSRDADEDGDEGDDGRLIIDLDDDSDSD
jgi:hypothetical protein